MPFLAPDTIVRDWLNERAEAGVVRAKAVTDVAYSDGVLTVTIEPEKFVDLTKHTRSATSTPRSSAGRTNSLSTCAKWSPNCAS